MSLLQWSMIVMVNYIGIEHQNEGIDMVKFLYRFWLSVEKKVFHTIIASFRNTGMVRNAQFRALVWMNVGKTSYFFHRGRNTRESYIIDTI